MRGRVPRDDQLAVAKVDAVAVRKPRNTILRDGTRVGIVAPLIAHGGLRAADKGRRIDEVSDAAVRNTDRRIRVPLGEVPGTAGVVEVGVRREDPREICGTDADRRERVEERLPVRTGTGVDHGRLLGVVHVHGPVLVGVEHPRVVNV